MANLDMNNAGNLKHICNTRWFTFVIFCFCCLKLWFSEEQKKLLNFPTNYVSNMQNFNYFLCLQSILPWICIHSVIYKTKAFKNACHVSRYHILTSWIISASYALTYTWQNVKSTNIVQNMIHFPPSSHSYFYQIKYDGLSSTKPTWTLYLFS